MSHEANHDANHEANHGPAWRRATEGEQRWAVTAGLLLVMAIQLTLPEALTPSPHWLLPALEFLVLCVLFAVNPHRQVAHPSPVPRAVGLVLAGTVSLANVWSVVALISGLLDGTLRLAAERLLLSGGAVWLVNVIAFSLLYWEYDRGGPAARARGERQHTDFLFPQMQAGDLVPSDWEPQFPDYFYLAFTNSTAFSPTDTLPLTRWAKMLMTLQSAVSMLTIALVVARAVNVLP